MLVSRWPAGILLLALLAHPALAQTAYTWNGGSGDWATASGWTPNGVPGAAAGDSAAILSGAVTLSAAPAQPLAALRLEGGQLTLTGSGWDLRVTSGAGTLAVGGAAPGSLIIDDDDSASALISIRANACEVAANGAIHADGTGPANLLGGDGAGPGGGLSNPLNTRGGGGGHAGQGAHADGAARGGQGYGDAYAPSLPGSAGGAGPGLTTAGAGGGRVRLLVGGTLNLQGRISANGRPATGDESGGGSGGSVWVTVGGALGGGQVQASGGASPSGGGGAGGRVAVDGYQGAVGWSLSAPGGSGGLPGSAGGTLVLQGQGLLPELTLAPSGSTNSSWPTRAANRTWGALTLSNAATAAISAQEEWNIEGPFTLPAGATAWVETAAAVTSRLTVRAHRAVLDGRLVLPKTWCDPPDPGQGVRGAGLSSASGGSHGGLGGAGVGAEPGQPRPAFDSPALPGWPGSCGADIDWGVSYHGGGALRLFVRDELRLGGTIDADGESNNAGPGGAGGAVLITAGAITGSGQVRANGGVGTPGGSYGPSGGGGGGRVAVFTDGSGFSGQALVAGGASPGGNPGQPGTALLPGGDARINLLAPAEGGFSSGALSWEGFALPAGATFAVYVDDDPLLGPGADLPAGVDSGAPAQRLVTAAAALAVPALSANARVYWAVIAEDANGNLLAASEVRSFTVGTDPSAPSPGVVSDGARAGADVDFQSSTQTLAASWSGFKDDESGVTGYAVAVGSSPGAADVAGWQPVGLSLQWQQAGLALTEGQSYFVSVRATNGAGLSTTATSDGVKVVALGGACQAGAECPSGFCVTGVCCDDPCLGGSCGGGTCRTTGSGGTDPTALRPRITSSYNPDARCGVAWQYDDDGRASASGDGPIEFRLQAPRGEPLPAGMRVDPESGELFWMPVNAQQGRQRAELVAVGPGGSDTQAIEVVVSCPPANLFHVCGCGAGGADLFAAALLALVVLGRRARERAPRS